MCKLAVVEKLPQGCARLPKDLHGIHLLGLQHHKSEEGAQGEPCGLEVAGADSALPQAPLSAVPLATLHDTALAHVLQRKRRRKAGPEDERKS